VLASALVSSPASGAGTEIRGSLGTEAWKAVTDRKTREGKLMIQIWY
jgi:hypothetical protein